MRSRPAATCWRGAVSHVRGCTSPKWRRALVDVEEGTATLVQGPTLQGYVFVDWSPAGTAVFITGGGRFKERTIIEYRLGTASARRLPVTVGDFFGMAAT